MRKNEPTALARQLDLVILADGGALADRSLAATLLAMTYVIGANAPNLDAATGTLTNQRRPLAITPFTFTSPGSNELHAIAHGLVSGDGPVHLSNAGGALPTGLAAATDYYVIFVDVDNIKLATSLANAYAGTAITVTGTGTGTHTLSNDGAIPSLTKRGVNGQFTYQFTQAETNNGRDQLGLLVDGTGYSRDGGGGAYVTIDMDSSSSAFTDILEAGHTRDDALRAVLRDAVGNIVITGSSYVVRDVADTKNSHHGTITAAGRSGAGIDDLT